MEDGKICLECVFYEPAKESKWWEHLSFFYCPNFPTCMNIDCADRDLVTGKLTYMSCHRARDGQGKCGQGGKYFKSKFS